jgi:hypothetical protein
MTSGEALFFKNVHGTPAFRLEVPGEHLEFAYGTYIGKDPHGDLYFRRDELDKLKKGGLVDASFSVKQVVENSGTFTERTYAHVKFYVPGSDTILGEFLARDENRQLSDSGIRQETLITGGTWEDAIWTHSSGQVKKSGAQFDIVCDGLHLTGGFTCDGALRQSQIHRAAEGVLNVRNHAEDVVNEGKMVRWTGNNLVFYKDTNAKVVSAYFSLSNETDPGQLGTDERGEIQYNDVKWTYHGL